MRIQRRGQRSKFPVDAMFNQEIPFSKRDSPAVRRRKVATSERRGAQVGAAVAALGGEKSAERDSLREMHKAMPGVWCGDGP